MRALAIRPDYVAAHYQLGRIFERAGQRDRAILHYREVVRHEPEHPAGERLSVLGPSGG